jgi:periplasmic mercuric ion binding protein
MKRTLATALAVLSFTVAAQAAEKSVKIAVSELSCPSCAYIVSTAMKEVPTVEVGAFEQDEVNWWEGTFTVTYDDASATPEMIVEAIMGYGYPASVIADSGS